MITTIIPYQQATLYQPAAPVPALTPEKDKAALGPAAANPAKADRIDLSPAAQSRLDDDARAEKTADDLKEAARKTIAALKRNQARDFTARGIEITDPDTAMPGRAVASLRNTTPQPVRLTDIIA